MSLKAFSTGLLPAMSLTSRKFAVQATVQFDDVHRGYGKAGAIDHAADTLHQGRFSSFEFCVTARLALGMHFGEVFVAVEGVVIDADFSIQRQ